MGRGNGRRMNSGGEKWEDKNRWRVTVVEDEGSRKNRRRKVVEKVGGGQEGEKMRWRGSSRRKGEGE